MEILGLGEESNPIGMIRESLTILQSYLPDASSISESFSFFEQLKSVDVPNKFMVFFDLASLFTNISLKQYIDLAASHITEGNPSLKLSKTHLTKHLSFAPFQANFVFNGKMYDQIDGVAMGNPLAPVLAILFLEHHENIWF